MKRIMIIVTASVLFGNLAHAGDINESPIRGKGTFSAVHNEPAANSRPGYTTEEINRSLAWLGRPEHEQIGRARVLHDDGAGIERSEITIKRR